MTVYKVQWWTYPESIRHQFSSEDVNVAFDKWKELVKNRWTYEATHHIERYNPASLRGVLHEIRHWKTRNGGVIEFFMDKENINPMFQLIPGTNLGNCLETGEWRGLAYQ